MQTERTLKDLVTADVSKLSQEEMYLRNSIVELAQWCNERIGLLEQGRKVGFRIGVTQQAADAIEAALPHPNGMHVVSNILRVE